MLESEYRKLCIDIDRLKNTEGAHTANDGRGVRRAFFNGVETKQCTACHEVDGWGIFHDDPPVVNRFQDIDEYIKYGKITVEFIEGARKK